MKHCKKFICTLLAVVLLFTAVPLAGFAGLDFGLTAEAATITSYKRGDIIEFGWYPQSEVTDADTIAALNAAGGEWISYNYYGGTGELDDGNMTASDYMRYKDVLYAGNKYRGVVFDSYRPHYTGYTSSASYTNQDDNGYSTNTVYWFKFDPIKWRVLDPSTGMVMSETILDSQAYNNYILSSGTDEYGSTAYWGDSAKTHYANNYEKSSIRAWLNNDFYNTAFSAAQQNIISSTTLDNSAYSTSYSAYDAATTNDKIYLLAYADALNTNYGFSSSTGSHSARQAQGSAYAKCQGLCVYSGNSHWLLRSAGYNSYHCCRVDDAGYVYGYYCLAYSTYNGVRPAFNFNLSSAIFQSNVADLGNSSGNGTGIKVNVSSNTSSAANKNNIVIIPHTRDDSALVGVTMNTGNVTTTNNKNNTTFSITSQEKAKQIKLSKTNYQDYIIPDSVVASWQYVEVTNITNFEPSYFHTAVMKKNTSGSKPYVSTVFAKESTFAVKEYVEMQSSKLKVHSNKNYTIFMSAGNTGSGISEYVIEQNANHKISSPDGVFASVDLFNELTYGLDCYAYVKRKDGTISELVKLNIDLQKGSLWEHLDSFQKNSKLNLLGKDFLKYKIPTQIPLFGDAEISFGAFQFPVGIEMEGDSIQISIGANIYKYGADLKQNSYDKYKKAKAEWFSDWKDIVNGVTVAEAIDKTIDKHLDAKRRYDNARESFFKKHWGKEDPTMTNKSKNFNVTGLGYIDATYMNGQLVIIDACLSIEGGYTFKYSQQGAIWVIPTYVYVEAGAPLGGSATGSRVVADNEVPFQWEWVLKITPKVNLGAGAGIKDFASLGLYANATMPIVFNLTKDVLTVDINGEFGAEAQFCIIKAKKAILTGTTRLLEHSWATKNTKLLRLPSYAVNTNVIGDVGTAQNTAQTEIVDRDYLSETSAWLGGTQTVRRVGASARALQQDGLVLTDLQTSVFEKAEPQVVAFGNNLLMTWVEDDATRDELNRMRLMYSIYDGSGWSQPKAVYDDGCNDTTPAIATDGTDVYFVWQKIASVITEETATIEHLVANTEIYTAVYDSASGEIKEVTRRTNNNCYDYAQAVAAESGEAVYYWATCEDNQMSASLDNTIYRNTADNTAAVAENLAYILSIAAEPDEFAYVTDTDNDLTTTDDINVFTVVDGSVVAFDKQGNEVAHNTATYGTIDGTEVLFVSDGKNIYYENNGEIVTILTADTTVNGLQFAEVNGLEYLFWTQNDEIGNVLYAVSYVDNTWTTPVRVSNTQSLLTCIDIAVLDNTLFGVCTSTEVIVNEEETTTETGATNLCWFRINDVQDVAITDIYIDEKDIVAGQETDFSVYVLNNGTQTIEKLTITVADGLGNEYTVEKQVNLLAGCGDFVDLTYTAPENFTTTMLTVAVDSSNIADGNLDNNSKEKQIGVPKMQLTESEMMTVDEKYLVTAMLTNESDVEAENVAIHVHSGDNENVIYEHVVEKVEAKGTVFVEFVVDENDLLFDENGIAKIYLQIEDSELYKGSQIVYIFEKKEATECAHSVTEVINIAEPSETQLGYTGDTICCGCGETLELGTEIPMICVHAWDDGVITTAPTCAEAGIKTFTCANDATHTYTEEIPAFGHSDEIIPAVDATCTATGLTEGKKCSACGEVLVEQIETPVLGHTEEILPALAPTCTTSGLTEGKKCTVCGEVTIEQTVVSSLGHTEEVISGTAATCTATGLTEGKKCTVCGEITLAQTEIAKLAHSKVTVNQKAATATENGYTGDVVCSVCSTEISKGKVIPATGDAVKNCDHLCHKDGFVGFIWKIVQFFWKLFKMNPVCECGKAHY